MYPLTNRIYKQAKLMMIDGGTGRSAGTTETMLNPDQ